jgi:hypothetical protein
MAKGLKSFLGSARQWLGCNTWLATWLEAAAVLAAAALGLSQLASISDSLESSAAASIFTQQLEVNKLFLQDNNHRLAPYFFDDEPIPANATDTRQKAGQIAGSILDFFSHVEDQTNTGSFEIDEGWQAYIRGSFKSSPILCETLSANLDAYGGAEGYLWKTFALDACLT